MELLRPCEYARRHGLDQKLVQARLADGRLPFVRVHPGRGGRRIPANARLTYKGPTFLRSHKHGGVLFFAGGPGRGRRLTLAERAADRAKHRVHQCACDLCLETARAQREDAQRAAMAALVADRRGDEDEREDEDAPSNRFSAF